MLVTCISNIDLSLCVNWEPVDNTKMVNEEENEDEIVWRVSTDRAPAN